MKYLVYLFIYVVTFLLQITHAYEPWNFNGSTPGLDSVVIGRCHQFQVINLDNRIPELQVNINCTAFWNKFSKIFAYKDPCMTNFTGAYLDLLKFIDNGKPLTDKAMFWSGIKEIAHDFTHVNYNYETLEDTFPGYFADNLQWCGCKNCSLTSGINYKNCNKNCDIIGSFWDSASKQFAERASGTAYVMVNGSGNSLRTAYWKESTFRKIELPAIGKQKQVKSLKIYVINTVDKNPWERCGDGTLVDLVKDAENLGITNIECIDDLQMVQFILCAKYPNSNECKVKKDIGKDNKEDKSTWKITAIVLAIVLSILLIVTITLTVHKKIMQQYHNVNTSAHYNKQ